MSAAFIGSKISLISKSEIRYEGILYTIDPKESTIALAKVRSFGTEDRVTDKPVPPRNEVYEYIIFRASDIKDLLVDDPPPSSPALADPAIIQAQSHRPAIPSSNFPTGSSTSASAGQQGISSLTSVLGRASPAPERSSSRRTSPALRAKSPAGSQTGQKNDSNRAVGSGNAYGGRSNDRSNLSGNNFRQARSGPRSQGNFDRSFGGGNRDGGDRNDRGPRRHNNNQHQQQSDWPARNAAPGSNRNARPRPTMLDVRKLEEFDFEKANAEFVELTKDVDELKITDRKEDSEVAETEQKKENVETYNKSKSFFDSISCEAIERQKGMARPDRRQERKLNQETFGVSGVYNRNWNRGGPRGGQRNNMAPRGYNQGGRGGPRNNGQGGGGSGGRGYNSRNYHNYNNNNNRSFGGNDRRPQGEKKPSDSNANSASATIGQAF